MPRSGLPNSIPYYVRVHFRESRLPFPQVGDEWVRSDASVVLRVPSVVVPQEHNYLINPRHSDVEDLEIGEPRPLEPDPRLPGE